MTLIKKLFFFLLLLLFESTFYSDAVITVSDFPDKTVLSGFLDRANQLLPNVNSDHCVSNFVNASLHVGCEYWDQGKVETKPCPVSEEKEESAPARYRLSWFTNCLAKALVTAGFQIPVYVIHTDLNTTLSRSRYDRVKKRAARVFHETSFITDHVIADMPNQGTHTEQIQNYLHGGAGSDKKFELCIWLLFSRFRTWDLSSDMCVMHGSDGLTPKDRSTILKNHFIFEWILNCTNGDAVKENIEHIKKKQLPELNTFINGYFGKYPNPLYSNLNFANRTSQKKSGSKERTCANRVSPAAVPSLQYALILEDDTFLSANALELLTELLIIPGGDNLEPYDAYFIDDSYCREQFKPGFKYPFPSITVAQTSKTASAVLMSRSSIELLSHSPFWMPSRRPIDHLYNAVFFLHNLSVAHAFPPVTGHGSQTGLENHEQSHKNRMSSLGNGESASALENFAGGDWCFGAFHDIATGKQRVTPVLTHVYT